MASIERILQLPRQRRALQEAADDRRRKERLEIGASNREAQMRQIAATVTLRALSAACAHGSKSSRPMCILEALTPHPNDAGLRPLWTKIPRPNQRRVPLGQHPHRIK
jgi:hypothetical protein